MNVQLLFHCSQILMKYSWWLWFFIIFIHEKSVLCFYSLLDEFPWFCWCCTSMFRRGAVPFNFTVTNGLKFKGRPYMKVWNDTTVLKDHYINIPTTKKHLQVTDINILLEIDERDEGLLVSSKTCIHLDSLDTFQWQIREFVWSVEFKTYSWRKGGTLT